MGNVKTFTYKGIQVDDWRGASRWKKFLDWEGFGCILEVDLEYPEELHNLHNEYPLAPERLEINKVEIKLIPNLNNKANYVLCYENLKLCGSLGLKIT